MQVTTLAVDLLQLAANYSYGGYLQSFQATNSSVKVVSYDDRFLRMMGTNVSASVPDQKQWQFVHEAGVYLPSTGSIYAASQSTSLSDPINITVLDGSTYKMTASYRVPGMAFPNGAARYNSTHLLFCAFGAEQPSALTLFEPKSQRATPLLTSFYGRNFSAVNDVRIGDDGSIWFTDNTYGTFEGFKPQPIMPNQVYRFDPKTGAVRAVADGFDQPNGLEFSSDYETLYINDSGYVHQGGNFNGSRPNTIYAYDVMENGAGLANRRILAYGANPFVDGMHVDDKGYIWASSGDGITAWDPHGVMLGEVRISTAVNNFMFVPDGILLLGFNKLWHIKCGARPRRNDRFE